MKTSITINQNMTSKEIAEITGKRHSHVMRDIENLNKIYLKLRQPKIGHTLITRQLPNGGSKQDRVFILNKKQCMTLALGYNAELRVKVMNRLEELETMFLTEQGRIASREKARLGCSDLTNALKEVRLKEGKETQNFHYSNEHNMIYRIVLGCTAKKFKEEHSIELSLRDNLTKDMITSIEKLQSLDTELIAIGLDYATRKDMLTKSFISKQKKIN